LEKTTDDAPACNAVRSTAGRDDTDIAGRPPRRASILKRSGALEIALLLWHAANRMDASLIEELITKDKPFKVETASGRVFEVPHRDFVSFSTRKTSLIISYEENGTEHFAIVPLLTITAATAPA